MNFRWKHCFILIFLLISAILKADTFRIVTYNVLNSEFVDAERYYYVTPEYLDWKYRREKIVEKLIQIEPEIICLQELDKESFEYFVQSFSNYEGYFANKGSSASGIGMFCKKNSFKAIHYRAKLCEGTSKCGKFAIQPLLIAELESFNGNIFTVINTKIKWSENSIPYDPIWNHVQCILNEKQKSSTIVVGDFNMEENHYLIKRLLENNLQDSHENFKYPTCYANQKYSRIDYILISPDLKATPFLIKTILEEIPNEEEPSDHLPIGCLIEK